MKMYQLSFEDMEEENLIPDYLIDTFYNRIKILIDEGLDINDNSIIVELNRIKKINNDIIPNKINNLINEK